MPISVYNTATRKKEEFVPLQPGRVLFYNCGPTVYDHFHIGNARNFVVFDAVRRHLRHRGYDVKYVQNLTDIDDKIINRANEEGVSSEEIAKRYTDYYFEKSGLLGVEPADVHPKATEHIPQIIALIQRLIKRGLAYPTPSGDVYFRVRAFEHYGGLSGRNVDDLRGGARVQSGEEKEDALDFALWKASKPSEPKWPSPWGEGRPGWHIECTAMIHTHLGETIDFHSGGNDLVFPHHENERAQSMGATGKEYVRHWLHNGFLNIEGEKMSKSLGNFRTIEDVLREYPAPVVRFFLLGAHYRNPLDFSRENLDAALASFKRMQTCLGETLQLCDLLGLDASSGEVDANWMAKYDEAMDDDFNSQRAIGVMFALVQEINELRMNRDPGEIKRDALLSLLATLRTMADLLGLEIIEESAGDGAAAPEAVIALASDVGASCAADATEADALQALIQRRAETRKAKDFATADAIRNRLAEIGYTLQDTAHGTTWKRDA